MIRIFNPNPRPTVRIGESSKEDFIFASRPTAAISVSFDICDWVLKFCEPKFAEVGTKTANDKHRNDKTELLFQLSSPSDTVELKLFKCEDGEEVEKATITDDTYGEFFDSTFFPDELKVGFIADWNLIINAFGTGQYFFESDVVILNQADDNRTWFYWLEPWDEIAANDTVRIQSFQRGPIDGGIDYTGFKWESEIRLRGKFNWTNSPLTKDHYQSEDRQDIQNRDRTVAEYTLSLFSIPYGPLRQILLDKNLANDTIIQSYELRGVLPLYEEFNVTPDSPGPIERLEDSNFVDIEITYVDKSVKPVKTNIA